MRGTALEDSVIEGLLLVILLVIWLSNLTSG